MIVVLGLYRGGSSAVAGVLHHLGVCMGHAIKRIPQRAPETHSYVCWEDWAMRHACRECFSEPELKPLQTFDERVDTLRDWIRNRKKGRNGRQSMEVERVTLRIPYDVCNCEPMGVKYPMLCALGEELEAAFGDTEDIQYVRVERDPDVAAKSLTRWFGQQAWELSHTLYDMREKFLADRFHATVEYDALVESPRDVVAELAGELRLDVTDEQVERAAASVDARKPKAEVA